MAARWLSRPSARSQPAKGMPGNSVPGRCVQRAGQLGDVRSWNGCWAL